MKKITKRMLLGAGALAVGYAAYLLFYDGAKVEPLHAHSKAVNPSEYPKDTVMDAECVACGKEVVQEETVPPQEIPVQESSISPAEPQEQQDVAKDQQQTDMPE